GHIEIRRDAGLTNPRAVRILGGELAINSLSISATSAGTGATGRETAIGAAGAHNLRIDHLKVTHFNYAATISGTTNAEIGRIDIDTYSRGLYVNDSKGVTIGAIHAHGKAPGATGSAGHNAILVESSAHDATTDLEISGGSISDSGEHGIRF